MTARTPRITVSESAGADFNDVDRFAVVDERQVVLVQGVQDEFDADEAQDGREAVGEVDEPVQQSVDQEEQLAQAHQRERGGGEDDKTFWVRPKMAGMESSANRMSVPPIATITSSIGVRTRLPFSMVKSLSPS